MEPKGEDFIVSELISELKAGNDRKDGIIRMLIRSIAGSLIVLLLSFAVFIWYLYQYDFTDSSEVSESITATGVYTLVDSEGNVVAYDISGEELEYVLEVLYGEDGKTDDNPQNQNS